MCLPNGDMNVTLIFTSNSGPNVPIFGLRAVQVCWSQTTKTGAPDKNGTVPGPQPITAFHVNSEQRHTVRYHWLSNLLL